jgi:hypothetical protein
VCNKTRLPNAQPVTKVLKLSVPEVSRLAETFLALLAALWNAVALLWRHAGPDEPRNPESVEKQEKEEWAAILYQAHQRATGRAQRQPEA